MQLKLLQIRFRAGDGTVEHHIEMRVDIHRRADAGVAYHAREGRQIEVRIVAVMDVIMRDVGVPQAVDGNVVVKGQMLQDAAVRLLDAAGTAAAEGKRGAAADVFMLCKVSFVAILDLAVLCLQGFGGELLFCRAQFLGFALLQQFCLFFVLRAEHQQILIGALVQNQDTLAGRRFRGILRDLFEFAVLLHIDDVLVDGQRFALVAEIRPGQGKRFAEAQTGVEDQQELVAGNVIEQLFAGVLCVFCRNVGAAAFFLIHAPFILAEEIQFGRAFGGNVRNDDVKHGQIGKIAFGSGHAQQSNDVIFRFLHNALRIAGFGVFVDQRLQHVVVDLVQRHLSDFPFRAAQILFKRCIGRRLHILLLFFLQKDFQKCREEDPVFDDLRSGLLFGFDLVEEGRSFFFGAERLRLGFSEVVREACAPGLFPAFDFDDAAGPFCTSCHRITSIPDHSIKVVGCQ